MGSLLDVGVSPVCSMKGLRGSRAPAGQSRGQVLAARRGPQACLLSLLSLVEGTPLYGATWTGGLSQRPLPPRAGVLVPHPTGSNGHRAPVTSTSPTPLMSQHPADTLLPLALLPPGRLSSVSPSGMVFSWDTWQPFSPGSHKEETITTVVKSPRGRRRSPSKSPSRSPSRRPASPPRLVALTPDLRYSSGAGQPPRPEVELGRKHTVPTLYVTEVEAPSPAPPGGPEPQPKWVEVEETIEVRVKKTGARDTSPAREASGSVAGLVFTLSGLAPSGDPNTNNSNNKLLAQEPQAQGGAEGPWLRPGSPPVVCIGEPFVFCVDAGGNVDWTAPGTGSPEPEPETPSELSPPWASEERPEVPFEGQSVVEEEEEGDACVIEEPQDTAGLSGRDPKILTHHGHQLTLADLEDYVPREGESFGCGGPVPTTSDDSPPCEVSVLQTEISEPTVGRPVLLAVGHPPGSQGPPSFFSHVPQPRASELPLLGTQARDPARVSFCVQGAQPGKTSFCTHVQHTVDSGQSSFKTEVSTQTVSFGTVGETVTLYIRPDGDESPSPSQS
ncbi:uncharacterized protein PS065_003340 [Dugong dugon]